MRTGFSNLALIKTVVSIFARVLFLPHTHQSSTDSSYYKLPRMKKKRVSDLTRQADEEFKKQDYLNASLFYKQVHSRTFFPVLTGGTAMKLVRPLQFSWFIISINCPWQKKIPRA